MDILFIGIEAIGFLVILAISGILLVHVCLWLADWLTDVANKHDR